MRYPTKVHRFGAFWVVSILKDGSWVRTRDLFCTREQARDARAWWANY